MLREGRFIPIPGGPANRFDHGAYDAARGRVFVAHTSADALVVIDHVAGTCEQTLRGFPEAAGVVVSAGTVLVSNRAAASVTTIDASTLAGTRTYATAARPNGVALAPGRRLALVACLGDETQEPVLHAIDLGSGAGKTLALPGSPRWCVVDQAEERVFCAIQAPSLVVSVRLAGFVEQGCWELPAAGAHGLDLDEEGGRLFVACDAGELVALDSTTGAVRGRWLLSGAPDATFYNPDSGLVHVAVKSPGLVATVDPASGEQWIAVTEAGAGTTALVRPDRLYVFLPERGGALELIEE